MKKYLSMVILCLGMTLSAADVKTPVAGEFVAGEFVWNELATPNLKAAKDFYGKMFGWEFSEKKMNEMTYTLVKKRDHEFAGIWAIPTDQQNMVPPHWIPYILVDNVEQTLEKARQNGATVLKPVQQAGDMGLFAILKDPTGAHFAVWQVLKK